MAHDIITINGRSATIRRAVIAPAWQDEKVLTSDLWTYVDLWIRRNAQGTDAQFFWSQAREFYRASLGLPITASPLALYYCFLNATKALLVAKKISFSDYHGVSGKNVSKKASLSNEEIKLHPKGVLPALVQYYGEPIAGTYTVKELLANLAFVHRAYCLSYSEPYHFFSLHDPVYVKAKRSDEAWISAGVEDRFDDKRILSTITPGFEKDGGFKDCLIVRKKKRFKWIDGKANRKASISNLTKYHSSLRKDITYIAGAGSWYLKRRHSNIKSIDRHTPTMIFAVMHRLSELSRYDPLRLSKILDTHRNWILAEFIKTAPTQFLDEIACELTGQEILVPQIHTGSALSQP